MRILVWIGIIIAFIGITSWLMDQAAKLIMFAIMVVIVIAVTRR